ncbi:hypothetical protein PFISCL1PPCAC_822, partial [Pristionchus fissidentatus]
DDSIEGGWEKNQYFPNSDDVVWVDTSSSTERVIQNYIERTSRRARAHAARMRIREEFISFPPNSDSDSDVPAKREMRNEENLDDNFNTNGRNQSEGGGAESGVNEAQLVPAAAATERATTAAAAAVATTVPPSAAIGSKEDATTQTEVAGVYRLLRELLTSTERGDEWKKNVDDVIDLWICIVKGEKHVRIVPNANWQIEGGTVLITCDDKEASSILMKLRGRGIVKGHSYFANFLILQLTSTEEAEELVRESWGNRYTFPEYS